MMNVLELSKRAQTYYENSRSKSVRSGFEKNVLVREDFDNCLFVKSEYETQPGDVLFRCMTRNSNTVIDLSKLVPKTDGIEVEALCGKFTGEEWDEILDCMNGIIYLPGIDHREAIEVKDEELKDKIRSLTKIEGIILLTEVQSFWRNRKDRTTFIAQYI